MKSDKCVLIVNVVDRHRGSANSTTQSVILVSLLASMVIQMLLFWWYAVTGLHYMTCLAFYDIPCKIISMCIGELGHSTLIFVKKILYGLPTVMYFTEDRSFKMTLCLSQADIRISTKGMVYPNSRILSSVLGMCEW